jgi:hypothetical protein
VPVFFDDGNGTFQIGTDVYCGVGPSFAANQAATSYDTWSFHYEHDGIDQDAFRGASVDQGSNGLDDDAQSGIDDPNERETSPPYPVALRGLRATIRMVENDTQQVRQTSISVSFIPE